MKIVYNKIMNIKSIKQDFIKQGQKVLEYELALAVGDNISLDPSEINVQSHPKIINTMLDLIKADTDIQKIQVKNTADILNAISKGDMNIKDAKEMVSLLALINGDTGDESNDTKKIIIEIAQGKPENDL